MKANFETGLKICSKCRKELSLDNFHKSKSEKDGLAFYCKECSKKVQKTPEQNKKLWAEGKKKAYMQAYLKTDAGVESQQRNTEKRIKSGKSKEYQKKRYNNDDQYRILSLLRTRFHSLVTGASNCAMDYIGCTIEEFKAHIESLFQEGMTWDNQGKKGWHLDHIIPCAYFNFAIEENQKICFNWRNLQPLWGSENCRKQNKVPDNVEQLVEQLKKEIYDNN